MNAVEIVAISVFAPLAYIALAAYLAGAAMAWKKKRCYHCRQNGVRDGERFRHGDYMLWGILWPIALALAVPVLAIKAVASVPFKLGETANERREKRAVS